MAAQPDPEIGVEFARRRMHHRVVLIIVAVLAVLVIVFERVGSGRILGMPRSLSVAVCALALVLLAVHAMASWRCSECSAPLGWDLNPRFCPRCGAQFRE